MAEREFMGRDGPKKEATGQPSGKGQRLYKEFAGETEGYKQTFVSGADTNISVSTDKSEVLGSATTTADSVSGKGKLSEKGDIKAQSKKAQRAKMQREYHLEEKTNPKTGEKSIELVSNKKGKGKKGSGKGINVQNLATYSFTGALRKGKDIVDSSISVDADDNAVSEDIVKKSEVGLITTKKIYRHFVPTAHRATHSRGIPSTVKKKPMPREAVAARSGYTVENDFTGPSKKSSSSHLANEEAKKRLQKGRIKREYVKARSKKASAQSAATYARQAVQKATEVARKLIEIAKANIGTIGIFAGIGMIFLMISSAVTSCGAMLGAGASEIVGCSYQSEPAQMDGVEDSFRLKELELQKTINNIEIDYPGYDEYNYVLDEIEHDPFVLQNYLSAKYVTFTADGAEADIQSIFDEMYTLTTTPRTETRTRTVTKTGIDEYGNEYEYEEEEEYEVTILDVYLTRKDLKEIVTGKLNSDELSIYEALETTKGALQRFYTPLDCDWYNQISCYYGYRINPISGEEQFHRGIDIAVAEGTEIYASISGTVKETGYDDGGYGNYIVISNSEGYESRYAHLSVISVSEGQSITHGDLIGKTGNTGASTGSHLHLECLYNGEYYNPLFYYENGNGSIYGTTDPIGGSGDVAALINEAENYLGYPYVWGGSTPETSFDCSGFVCWVYTNSGYADLPRTTAQNIYNKCEKIDASEARAGDLIFFTGTYNSGNPVSHVGIYAGNGQMIHCGNPIKYASVNTSYWQSHFYAYGRLPVTED